ncbi:MAG: MbnP family protein [Saprospiraceae bacterium]
MFYLFVSLIAILFSACSDKNEETNIKFNFTFNWDGNTVNLLDFNNTQFTNEKGTILTITRMRYLLSNIKLYRSEDSIIVGAYNLVDLTNSSGLEYDPEIKIPSGSYDSLSFTFGFDSIDNLQSYPDLNTVNWNWPTLLGGGYHFMQYEGKFIDNDGLEQPYAYHMGTARKAENVFEQNYFNVTFKNLDFKNGDANIEIQMNIAEWFKDPYTWDLNTYSTPLMPNYDAQKLMNANGRNVFSLGKIDQ